MPFPSRRISSATLGLAACLALAGCAQKPVHAAAHENGAEPTKPIPEGGERAADEVAATLDRIAEQTSSKTSPTERQESKPLPPSPSVAADRLINRTLSFISTLDEPSDISPDRVGETLGIRLSPDPDWPLGRAWAAHGPMPGGSTYRISATITDINQPDRFEIAVSFSPEGERGDPRRPQFSVLNCPFPIEKLIDRARAAGFSAPRWTIDRSGNRHTLHRKAARTGQDELVIESDLYHAESSTQDCVLRVTVLANVLENGHD